MSPQHDHILMAGTHKTLLAQKLFNVLQARVAQKSSNRVSVVELATLKHKDNFFALLNHLKSQKYITVEISVNLAIIHLTEQGVLRLQRYKNW